MSQNDPSGYGKGAMQPCQPASTVEWTVPRGIELWFSAVCLISAVVETGDATFGDYIRTDGDSYYPMRNNGFHTVQGTDMLTKASSPLTGVVSFFGQTSCGTVSFRNDTAQVINVMLTWRPRTLRETV